MLYLPFVTLMWGTAAGKSNRIPPTQDGMRKKEEREANRVDSFHIRHGSQDCGLQWLVGQGLSLGSRGLESRDPLGCTLREDRGGVQG